MLLDLGSRRWVGSRPCSAPGCSVRCWRFCIVCGRWVCREHRNGVGWWFRCLTCPFEAFVQLSRDEHQRKKDHRQLERDLDRLQRCGWCFTPHRRRGVAYSPACECHRVKSSREVFAGI